MTAPVLVPTATALAVPAVGTTADGTERTEFDAADWLSCATDRQLAGLTAAGFAGTVPTGTAPGDAWPLASVAQHYSCWSTADLLWHARSRGVAYTITIDPDAAAAWIAAHRPHMVPGAPRVLTPVSSDRCDKTHATLRHDPIGERVLTLCGRTLRVNAAWTAGTFDRHARDARANYIGGGCVQCTDAAGLSRP